MTFKRRSMGVYFDVYDQNFHVESHNTTDERLFTSNSLIITVKKISQINE